MSNRTAARQVLAGALPMILTAPGLLLVALNLSQLNTHRSDFWLEGAVVAALYPAVGAFFVSRRPENLVGWLLFPDGWLPSVRW